MIIWQGFGLLVIIVPVIVGGLLCLLFPQIIEADWFIGFNLFFSGVILYWLGKKLHNPSTNEITLYDKDMVPYVLKRHTDTFYFIPMEYWGIIFWIFSFIWVFISFFVNE